MRSNYYLKHTLSSSSLKFALFISLSFTTNTNTITASHHRTLSPTKATAVDLLSLLGPAHRAAQVDPTVARDLWSCLNFLVPFHPTTYDLKRRSMTQLGQRRESDAVDNGRIWWPPPAVPDIEGSKECKCELTRTPYGRHFIHEELNTYIRFLFEMIVSRGPAVGLNVSLSRYDFFHGHVFLAKETGRLGILFHAKEYPAYEKKVFPFNMGYCQTGSNVAYDKEMNLRNILWLAPMPSTSNKDWVAPGVLVVLNAHPDGIIYRDLIPDYVQVARTIYEDDFGKIPVDVNYLKVGGASNNYQLFIC
ncbi:hypothetical protein KSS87_019851 [Heliosperma pusillum]|nr:hypothetical protein KSS87_019851 [Heliosperma pusillum]